MSRGGTASITSSPSSWLSLCSSSLHSSHLSSSTLLVCYSYFNCSFFLHGGYCIPFLFFWISWISISGSDVFFRKFFISGYLLPFLSLYLGSLSIFVCTRVLHFSFSFSFLQLCSIGQSLSSNRWFPWNISLCISKHCFISSSYLLHTFYFLMIFL